MALQSRMQDKLAVAFLSHTYQPSCCRKDFLLAAVFSNTSNRSFQVLFCHQSWLWRWKTSGESKASDVGKKKFDVLEMPVIRGKKRAMRRHKTYDYVAVQLSGKWLASGGGAFTCFIRSKLGLFVRVFNGTFELVKKTQFYGSTFLCVDKCVKSHLFATQEQPVCA